MDNKILRKQKLLGQILIEKKLITTQQLSDALKEQEHSNEFLGQILKKRGIIKEDDLLTVLAEQFNIPYIKLKDRYIDWNLIRQFSPSLIIDYKYIPLARDDWAITFATTNPMDINALKKAEDEAGVLKAKLVLINNADMEDIIHRYRQYLRGNISNII